METTTLNYDSVTRMCRNIGAILPEPRSERERDFLRNLTSDNFLLGLRDTQTDGQWVWDSDGTALAWTSWLSGEPNGGTSENCVRDRRDYDWHDVTCDYVSKVKTNISVVCEKGKRGR